MSVGLKNTLRRLSSSAVMILVLAAPAMADDSVFLVQLGSYGSKTEASSTWDSLQSKNSDVLGSLTLHVAEVSLPPDNKTSYRIQAGPLSSHDQAASVCSSLKSRKVPCFVVETALFTSDTAPKTASIFAPVDSAPAAADVSPPPEPPSFSSPFSSSAPAAAPAPVMTTTTETLASAPEAVSTESQPSSLPFTPPPPPRPPVVTEAAADDAPKAAPVTISETTSTDSAAPDNATSGEPITKLPFVNPMLIKNSTNDTTTASEPVVTSSVAAAAPSPYAPAPMAAATPAMDDSSSTPAPQPKPKKKPGFFSRLFGSSDDEETAQVEPAPTPVTSSATTPAASGKVDVAEAIRVPLGSGHGGSSVHSLGGSPSQESGQKTFWAQLSYFSNEDDARHFYDGFRDAYPDLTDGVRMRITHPYAAGNGSRVSLRVGPFASNKDVNTICAAAHSQDVHCLSVRDIGSSIAANTPRTSGNYRTYASRGDENDPESVYWGHLGTFKTQGEAWKEWNALKAAHKDILGHVHVTVTLPPASSANKPLYRLRTGPFVVKASAVSLCEKLHMDGTGCLVVLGN